jgi:formylglycine-generating enzyme required for sulfatase activity
MGSTENEVRFAIALCRKEPRGDDSCEKLFVNEMEAHEVTLSAYYIDRTEVTVAAYKRCVELGRCSAVPYASGAQRFDRPDYPVTLVTWNDADQYCQFAGGRLPTEAEWERAARGASGRRFPWGSVYNKNLANHGSFAFDDTDDGDGYSELAPVGSFPLGRTPDGIDDMAGNVEEWVADAFDDASQYPSASEVNPKGTGSGVLRIARGGAYKGYPGPLGMTGIGAGAPWMRGASRGLPHLASERQTFRGFRCVHPASGGL